MRRTKEQAAETREAILRSAEDLFVERGLDHVSLDEIATAAGVKRGAVHFHFVNKQGILVAMCEQSHSPLRELVERLETEHSLSALDELLTVATDSLRSFDGDRRRCAVFRSSLSLSLSLEDEGHAAAVAAQRGVLSLIARALDAAAAAGTLARPWTASTAALALHACIIGFLTQWATGEADASMVAGAVESCTALIESFRAAPLPAEAEVGVGAGVAVGKKRTKAASRA
jgi:AcrR family transcriptional regulator